LSIAVDSKQYGPALFPYSGSHPVLALIQQFDAVGGIRRFAAGRAQFYPVITSDGTYILIRSETGTEQAARAYTEFPPTVADAWFGAMRESGPQRMSRVQWLWPAAPEQVNGHR
jgi:hypothetical protein